MVSANRNPPKNERRPWIGPPRPKPHRNSRAPLQQVPTRPLRAEPIRWLPALRPSEPNDLVMFRGSWLPTNPLASAPPTAALGGLTCETRQGHDESGIRDHEHKAPCPGPLFGNTVRNIRRLDYHYLAPRLSSCEVKRPLSSVILVFYSTS